MILARNMVTAWFLYILMKPKSRTQSKISGVYGSLNKRQILSPNITSDNKTTQTNFDHENDNNISLMESSTLETRELSPQNINLDLFNLVQKTIFKSYKNTATLFEIFRYNLVFSDGVHNFDCAILSLLNCWCQNNIDFNKECKIYIHKFFRILFYLVLQPFYRTITSPSQFIEMIYILRNSLTYIRSFVTYHSDFIDNESWLKILEALIDVYHQTTTLNYLNFDTLTDQQKSIKSSFFSYFFQTIFLTWLRGNMFTIIPSQLWDKFTDLLKHGSYYNELFDEWLYCLDIITKIYCSDVFHVDISNLPLNREFDTRRRIKNIGKDSERKNITHKHKPTTSFTRIKAPQDINTYIKSPIEPSSEQPLQNINKETAVKAASFEVHKQQSVTERKPSQSTSLQTYILSNTCKIPSNQDMDLIQQQKNSLQSSKSETAETKKINFKFHRDVQSLLSKTNSSIFYDSETTKHTGSYSATELYFQPDMLYETQDIIYEPTPQEINETEQNSEIITITTGDSNYKEEFEKDDTDTVEGDKDISDNTFEYIPKNASYCNREHVFITWRRILGLFGNINELIDSKLQFACYRTYYKMFLKLEDVAKNLGIQQDLKYIPPFEKEQPMLHYFLPLTFELLKKQDVPNDVYLEAEKLALRSLLTPYNFAIIPKEYYVIFIDIFTTILTGKNIYYLVQFFKHATSIISSKINGIFILFKPLLTASQTLFSHNIEPPLEAALILLSMCEFFYCFPSIQFGKPPNSYILFDIFPQYIEIIVTGCSMTRDPISRSVYLSCISQIAIENIINKKNECLVKFILTIIMKHLYCRSISVVSFVLNILNTFFSFYDFFMSFDANLLHNLFSYSCNCIYSIITIHLKISNKLYVYNTLIVFINMLTDIIFKISPSKSNIQILLNCITNLSSHENLSTHGLTSSPNLYEWEILQDSQLTGLSVITKLMVDLEPDKISKNNETLKTSQLNINPLDQTLNYETIIQEREFSFYSRIQHLIDFCFLMLYNFPLSFGPDSLSCQISESDLITSNNDQKLPDCIILCIGNQIMISVFEFKENLIQSSVFPFEKSSLIKHKEQFVIIVRTALGKYSWISSELYHKPKECIISKPKLMLTQACCSSQIKPNVDPLHKLITSSIKAFEDLSHNYELNKTHTTFPLFPHSNYMMKLLKLHNKSSSLSSELDTNNKKLDSSSSISISNLSDNIPQYSFKYRLFIQFANQLGYFNNEYRPLISFIEPSEKFFRDMKQIDNRFIRNTHKIAIFYINPHQEDKESVLKNTVNSKRFDSFLLGVGWFLDLEKHNGFLGGLDRVHAKGYKTLYYCSPVNEVIFHIAPLMPANEGVDGLISKLRHLGNDEVHIIWSEHYRPFRQGIINTEFGDVLIVIYPLSNGLFKINIVKKEGIPLFGPLYDGAIIPFRILSVLIRETAINASNVIRMSHHLFKTAFEDRLNLIKQLNIKYSSPQSFEQYLNSFISKINKN
ncbi:hypothetical protein HZS_2836 [Henneguya salminicola]|nr:hypothetical protein HZS_2836 [Henneguya salminicola]